MSKDKIHKAFERLLSKGEKAIAKIHSSVKDLQDFLENSESYMDLEEDLKMDQISKTVDTLTLEDSIQWFVEHLIEEEDTQPLIYKQFDERRNKYIVYYFYIKGKEILIGENYPNEIIEANAIERALNEKFDEGNFLIIK